jgi:hypothetical protein
VAGLPEVRAVGDEVCPQATSPTNMTMNKHHVSRVRLLKRILAVM